MIWRTLEGRLMLEQEGRHCHDLGCKEAEGTCVDIWGVGCPSNGGYEDWTQETHGEVPKSSLSPQKSMPLIKGTNPGPSPPIHHFPSLLFVIPTVSCREWKGWESHVPFPFLPPSPQKATPRPIYDLHRLP